ncbi:hypothetical protein G6F64_006686 [Rhizopus arrhizus]|uniref:Uncharacterized protein n=1 Tax=Rhizopus oryzae TaxID=64495 RepID=A0A9P6X8D3_RHIOR|nr:hypothetical protein G6F64_006686 [Rhizopus arrhizus]
MQIQINERYEKDNQGVNHLTTLDFLMNWEKSIPIIKIIKIPGIQFQHQNNENQGSSDNNHQIMSLGGQSNWENDFGHPSNRRSSTTCFTSSKKFYEEFEIERQQELERALFIVNKQPTEFTMALTPTLATHVDTSNTVASDYLTEKEKKLPSM